MLAQVGALAATSANVPGGPDPCRLDDVPEELRGKAAAVLDGARLVADGCAGASGIGELVVLDPGGATTDVHSVATGAPSTAGVVERGLPEPRLKRTVEGDLGMRHNAATIVDAAGIEAICRDAPCER